MPPNWCVAPILTPFGRDDEKITRGEKIDKDREFILLAHQKITNALNDYVWRTWSDMGHRRNELSPIHRCPNEIFARIFEFAAHDAPSSAIQAPLNIAAVSRRWRAIALELPTIWTKMHGRSVAGFLPRTKNALLDIYQPSFKVGHTPLVTIMPLLLPHSNRWGSVHLAVTAGHITFLSETLVNVTAERLGVLIIQGDTYGRWGSNIVLDQNIFSGHTPQLRELNLARCEIHLSSSLYSGLTKLSLTHIYFRDARREITRALFRALVACPDLEELNLTELESQLFHSGDQGTPPPTSEPIHLARLYSLTLARNHPLISWSILELIHCPSVVQVSLDGPIDPVIHNSKVYDIFSKIPNLPHIRRLCIEPKAHWIIRGWGGDDDDAAKMGEAGERKDQELLTIRLHSSRETEWSAIASILYSFVDHFPTPLVEKLEITLEDRTSQMASLFRSFLANLPLLTHLSITGTFGPLAHMLIVNPDQTPLCPNLVFLKLTNSLISSKKLVELVQSRSSPNSSPGEDAQILQAGSDASVSQITATLRSLQLANCKYATNSTIAKLLDMGCDVEIVRKA